MATATLEIGAAVVEGDIIITGGLDQSGRSLDSVASYDPAAQVWTGLASMPGPRDHAAVAEWDGRVFVSGGGELARREVHANLWAYDPVADAWASLTPMPRARWQHAMVAIDGVLYVVGGLIEGTDDHSAVWAYDIAADAWRTGLAALPTPREHLAAVAADGRVVALGGRMGPNLATVEIYDSLADAWAGGPEMLTPRSGFAAVLMADGLHVTGGEDFGTGRTIAAHERLDLADMTWSTLPELPIARHGIGSGAVGERWYVIGGGRDVGLSASDLVEVWTPAS
jgi:hypothetical protein